MPYSSALYPLFQILLAVLEGRCWDTIFISDGKTRMRKVQQLAESLSTVKLQTWDSKLSSMLPQGCSELHRISGTHMFNTFSATLLLSPFKREHPGTHILLAHWLSTLTTWGPLGSYKNRWGLGPTPRGSDLFHLGGAQVSGWFSSLGNSNV